MDIAQTFPQASSQARNFVLRGVGWSLAFFGIVRLSWIETHVLLPLTALQGRFAFAGFGMPALPIEVSLACSGADAFALCAGAILAYPVRWRMRLAGTAVGIAVILILNTARIGTLGRAAGSAWFEPLHVYVWPAILALAIAGFVFAWMRAADARMGIATTGNASAVADRAAPIPVRLTPRFAVLTAVFLLLFVLTAPLYLQNAGVLAVAALIASSASWILSGLGVQGVAYGNVLSTARGAFLVTQECVTTPLIPVYLAAVVAYAPSWRTRALALAVAGPLFFGLGVARLLVVALPPAIVSSPLFLIHAFYQLLLGGAIVFIAACWRHGVGATALRRASIGAGVGALLAYVIGPVNVGVIPDPQGAIALLPAVEAGLYVALFGAASRTLNWRHFGIGLSLLGALQLAAFTVVYSTVGWAEFAPHARNVRAWTLACPVLAFVGVIAFSRSGADPGGRAYRRFWAGVGEQFPDLGGAASTRYYADNERRLFTEHFPALAGLKILKTDLWDEAKNTRILAWASEQGARAYGIDISNPTVLQARAAFHHDPLRCTVSDVRALPFCDDSFDAIYSMGTIEHFDETEHAVAEMARVLAPGGRAIVGVPNRHDPFLRPLLATVLQWVGMYGYGFEKSYSRRALREMLQRAGLTVVTETAILFIPGWLRMLDLACHSWCRPLASVTGACVWPFVFLDRHVPAVRNHGYLLATVVTKDVSRAGRR